jgi:hypothetical protein
MQKIVFDRVLPLTILAVMWMGWGYTLYGLTMIVA